MINELSPESIGHIDYWVTKFPAGKKRSAIIASLQFLQEENNGHLSSDIIQALATYLNLPVIQIYEVATFYSMFNLEPVGENFVQICRTTPCWLRGSDKLVEIAKEVSNTKLGETSDDKKFTIVEVECLGACCNAPMVQINDDYYEDLNEDSFKKLLTDLKQSKEIKKGSQIGRQTSHPQREKNA